MSGKASGREGGCGGLACRGRSREREVILIPGVEHQPTQQEVPALLDSPTTSPNTAGRSSENGSAAIDKYFRAMCKHSASHLHFKADAAPKFRLKGEIRNVDADPLRNEDIESLVFKIMDESQIARYREQGALDFAYQVGNAGRFSINLFRQRGMTSIVARRVPAEIKNFAQLNLPESLAELAKLNQGLLLVAGPAGSGKSAAIAALLEEVNQTRACHIMTLEDPIEFVYEDKLAFVSQREIGLDVSNYPAALKCMLREDPDVVLIGELDDQETLSAALAVAETGHLVLGTVHASSAAGTISRILEMYPENNRALIRSSLALNLAAIVCLRLLPGLQPDVPRVPVYEIMICNSTLRKMIVDGREGEIATVVRNSAQEGMIDFTESIRQLVDKEWISAKTAYVVAPNPNELKMRLQGISVSGGGIIG